MVSRFVFFICVIFSAHAIAESTAVFTIPSGVEVSITEELFELGSWKVEKCRNGQVACLINGSLPFGTDFSLPTTYVKNITIFFEGHAYELDGSNMFNAWGRRPLEIKNTVRYFGGKCADIDHCRLRGIFSDGAGTFVAEWVITNGTSTRTILSDDSDIIDLFLHQIDPPQYD